MRDLDGGEFEPCPVRPVSSTDEGGEDGRPAGDVRDDDSGACLDVSTDATTGIFDETGARAGLDAVANDDPLTAIGFLRLHDDDDDDDDDGRGDHLRLDAQVLELGAAGTFTRLAGVVVSAPGNHGIFEFDPTPDDAVTNAIDVRLQSGTRIFALGSNEELTSAVLQPGTAGGVDGVFTAPETSGEPLKPSLVVLDQNATSARAIAGATIASIAADDDTDSATRRVTVDVNGEVTGQCVRIDASTLYLRITESEDASGTAEIAFADPAVGDNVDVFGADDPEAGCVPAETIRKYVDVP